jgi:hippurate hydrolase
MLALTLALSLAATPPPAPAAEDIRARVTGLQASLKELYVSLHRQPELSGKEEKTAAALAQRLEKLGFQVTRKVGGHGIVGVLKNGAGPTVMLRTDLDGLPVEERTGLPYASKVQARNDAGQTVSVMHACGHDVHMTSWLGAATVLSQAKARWRGTLVMVGQPAEETGQGAKGMLAQGLFEKFPKPDFAVALHVAPDLAAGRLRYVPGYALANVDSVNITLYGKGGHGAYPHKTVDPIVLASRVILGLQTLVSRENDPLQPAVVTVGSIHGGTKHNIIPDDVKLQLSVRSYSPEVRKGLLDGIQRIAELEAQAARAPRAPKVEVLESTGATFNDPPLTARLAGTLTQWLGGDNVEEGKPVMGAEDFGAYGRAGAKASMLWLGVADPARLAAANAKGEAMPALHSPLMAPEPDRALPTGVLALTASALELLGKP